MCDESLNMLMDEDNHPTVIRLMVGGGGQQWDARGGGEIRGKATEQGNKGTSIRSPI